MTLKFTIYLGNALEYIIYDKFEVQEADLSCTNQNTNGKIEVTLITCNNVKGNRLVFKCVKKMQENRKIF